MRVFASLLGLSIFLVITGIPGTSHADCFAFRKKYDSQKKGWSAYASSLQSCGYSVRAKSKAQAERQAKAACKRASSYHCNIIDSGKY